MIPAEQDTDCFIRIHEIRSVDGEHMLMSQGFQRPNLMQDLFLFEEMRRGPDGNLRAQIDAAHSTCQDDFIDPFFRQCASGPLYLDGDAFVGCELDMLAFWDPAHDEPPLRDEELLV